MEAVEPSHRLGPEIASLRSAISSRPELCGLRQGKVGVDRETVPISCPSVTVARDTSMMEAMQPLRIVRDTLLQDSTAGKTATQIYYSR